VQQQQLALARHGEEVAQRGDVCLHLHGGSRGGRNGVAEPTRALAHGAAVELETLGLRLRATRGELFWEAARDGLA